MPVQPRIEVFGLCGAGKSTVIDQILPLLHAAGCTISPTRPAPPSGPQALARAAILIARAHPLAFLSRTGNWWLPMKLGYRHAALHQLDPTRSHLLLDSGILQPFISFAIEYSPDPAQQIPHRTFRRALPSATAAIHIHAPAETAMQRYIARAQAQDIPLPDRDWPRHFAAGATMTETIIDSCRQQNCPVIHIDNAQPPSPAALASAVDSLLGHLAPPQ